jgi:hypothetical protein
MHVIKLFDDVAIKFDDGDGKLGAEFGRIVRMRKKAGSKWLDYVLPVDLNNRGQAYSTFVPHSYLQKWWRR